MLKPIVTLSISFALALASVVLAAPASAVGEGLQPTTPELPAPDADASGDDADTDAGAGAPIHLSIALALQVDLSSGHAGDPVSVAPDLWLVMPGRLPSFGLVHSSDAITGFHGVLPAPSLCVAGATCDAAGVYDQVGLLARVPVWAGESASQIHAGVIGLEAGAVLRSLDPSVGIDVKLGAALVYGKALRGIPVPIRTLFEAWPSVLLSVTDRDTKRDQLNIPVAISLERALGIQTGLSAPLGGFGDGYRVPLGVFIAYPILDDLMASLAFTLPAVVGGDAVPQTGWDARVLTFTLTYAPSL